MFSLAKHWLWILYVVGKCLLFSKRLFFAVHDSDYDFNWHIFKILSLWALCWLPYYILPTIPASQICFKGLSFFIPSMCAYHLSCVLSMMYTTWKLLFILNILVSTATSIFEINCVHLIVELYYQCAYLFRFIFFLWYSCTHVFYLYYFT